jgi:hypothetical protein
MKKCLFMLLALASMMPVYAQCPDATGYTQLDINNVKAGLLTAGDFWWDLNDAVYVVPNVDTAIGAVEVSSFFSGAIWMGGVDPGGDLLVAAQTYRQSGTDFWPGPLDASGSGIFGACEDYDRHWKVHRDEIQSHQLLNPPISVGLINTEILYWPAKGNPFAKGRGLTPLTIADELAPFIDVNGDGVYDPRDGDYPDVPGDQAIFWVFNDNAGVHGESGASPLQVQVHALAYAYKGYGDIDNTTFYQFKVIPKGSTVIDSFYFGYFADIDLGAFDDDFIAVDSSLGLLIGYNGDAVDGPTSPNYGDEPPISAVQWLGCEGNLGATSAMFYNNDFSVVGNPEFAVDYWRYMQSIWKDETPLTRGGNGYNPSSTEYESFIFPDDPALPFPAWSECSQNHDPFDRRGLLSSGPYSMSPGDTMVFDMAAIWTAQGTQSGCVADLSTIRAAAMNVQSFFDSIICDGGYRDLLSVGFYDHTELSELILYPNPSSQAQIELSAIDLNLAAGEQVFVEVWDIMGRRRLTIAAQVSEVIQLTSEDLSPGNYLVLLRDQAGVLRARSAWIVQ